MIGIDFLGTACVVLCFSHRQEGLQRAEVTTRSLLMVSESQDLHTLKLSFATTRHGSHARSDLETVEDNGRGLLVMLQHAAWISLVGCAPSLLSEKSLFPSFYFVLPCSAFFYAVFSY